MTDLGGKDRLNGSQVDMGCYEYHGEQYCLVPTNLTITSTSLTSSPSFAKFAAKIDGAILIMINTSAFDQLFLVKTVHNVYSDSL